MVPMDLHFFLQKFISPLICGLDSVVMFASVRRQSCGGGTNSVCYTGTQT